MIANACDYQFAGSLRNQTGAKALRVRDQTDHEAASNGDDLILDDVKTNDGWCGIVIEVASHGVANHGLQFFQGFRLSENGVPEGAGFKSTFGRVLNRKNYFTVAHAHNYIPWLTQRMLAAPELTSANVRP